MTVRALEQSAVLATARVAETLEALYLVPRNAATGTDVLRLVKNAAGEFGQQVTRSAHGIRIPDAIVGMVQWENLASEIAWSADAQRFAENRSRVRDSFSEAFSTIDGIKRKGAPFAKRLIGDCDGLDTLDDHQVVNVAAMAAAQAPGLCVFDEQGAGKTVTLIFAFDLLVARDEADQAIIIAPKSMVGEWPKDILRFRGDLYKPVVVAGSNAEKRRALTSEGDIFITNFETAVSMEAELKALMRARPGRTVLVVDESFFIKSIDAKRTRALRRLREWAGKAFVLCGTPAPNSAADLVQQVNFVDFGHSFGGVAIPDDREAAAPVVREVFESRALFTRHLKADVLPDLPAKRFQRVFVQMEREQRRLYETALGDLIHDVEGADIPEFAKKRVSFLARRSALLQICSNPVAVSPHYIETPAKLSALDALLEELIDHRNEKVVLWSFYTASVEAILRRYRRYGAVRYDGAVTSVEDRREAVRRFQEDEGTKLFVGNPAAAGAGLTLHRAKFAIYESLSNQAAHYLQSLDRIHRRGQDRAVEYLVLLCDQSLEVQEYDRLIAKENSAQALLGDHLEPALTRHSFLSELQTAAAMLEPGHACQ